MNTAFIQTAIDGDRRAIGRAISALENGGRSRQSGVEGEATARALDLAEGTLALRLSGSHGWGQIETGAFAGQPVPRLRAWQASASATWRRPLASGSPSSII